ncbi:Hsp20/alpha crystallin family protein [Sulfidibacter corallicola]|uniref:Hsp20/alpha crystallin family protein n=1 Tax=Sulfidibacter corallicola TaxID=2818388 RepID=A0A8A4TSB4_SULCO|nr:Hsp20 family protein [Sulfidibacter corallicola]QTD49435.1 Hsp20/alpha crystallin family protein [Sulfidibacter corallicola]
MRQKKWISPAGQQGKSRNKPGFTDKEDPYYQVIQNYLPDQDAQNPDIKVNIFNIRHQMIYVLDLPGVKKRDIRIRPDKSAFTVWFSREKPRNFEPEYRESYFGSANRTFSCPTNLDWKKADIDFQDGVLTLTVPFEGSLVPTDAHGVLDLS